MICKSKRSFYSEEDASVCRMDNQKAYHCPHCGNWHLTAHGTKNKKRFQEFKRRRK